MPRRTALRNIIIAAVALLIVCGGILVTLHLMVSYRPPAYAPRLLTAAQQETAEARGWLLYQDLHNQARRRDSFRITVTQTEINELLLLDDTRAYWRQLAGQIGAGDQPQVVLKKDVIEIMLLIDRPEVRTVLTVAFTPRVQERQLILNLGPVQAGAMEIPKSLLKRYLPDRATSGGARGQAARERPRGKSNLTNYVGEELLPQLFALGSADHIAAPTEFNVDERQRVRILSVSIDEGAATFTLEPIE
jgi:hypothetical protein